MANLRDKIIEHLTLKGSYDEKVDDYVIDILIDNIAYAKSAKEDIKERGLLVEMTNGNGFITRKENPSFSTYRKALDNIHMASQKLGISRADRLRLKIVEAKIQDEFDSMLKE